MTPRIQLRGLTRRLPSGGRQLTIVDRIDLSIAPGEFVAVLGPSGSGKSTLLALMAGLDRPSEGQVVLDGREIQDLSEDDLALLRRRTIGFVFQSFQLLGNLTALENVLLPLELADVPDARSAPISSSQPSDCGERGHHYPSQLSGGEQQRVALARAFGPRPPILLADEPTGNLDRVTGPGRARHARRAAARERHDPRPGDPRPGGRRSWPTGGSICATGGSSARSGALRSRSREGRVSACA